MIRDYYSVIETAKELNKNPETIRRWIRMNQIKFIKIGKAYYIKAETIENLFREV